MLLPLLVSLVLMTPPPTTVSEVPCVTVADCWLDANSKAIARPKKYRGKPVPGGDCGKNLHWLQSRLTCEEKRCAVQHIGDRC